MNSLQLFPQLNNAINFNNWKFRVKTLLEEKGVSYVLKDNAMQQEEYMKDDSKAKAIIVQCLPDKYLDIVKKAKSAKEMVDQLEGMFERKSVFNKLHLRRQLLTLKCSSDGKIQDHFLKFDNLLAELEATGCKMDESDKICHLLLTMPEEYDNVITALETMSADKELIMDFVKSRLLDAEIKLKGKEKIRKLK